MNNIKIVTFRERIRRAIKAFKGEKVGSLDFGITVTKCSECEYKNKPKVIYLCDQTKCSKCNWADCRHTEDIAYAVDFTQDADGNYVQIDWDKEAEEIEEEN